MKEKRASLSYFGLCTSFTFFYWGLPSHVENSCCRHHQWFWYWVEHCHIIDNILLNMGRYIRGNISISYRPNMLWFIFAIAGCGGKSIELWKCFPSHCTPTTLYCLVSSAGIFYRHRAVVLSRSSSSHYVICSLIPRHRVIRFELQNTTMRYPE